MYIFFVINDRLKLIVACCSAGNFTLRQPPIFSTEPAGAHLQYYPTGIIGNVEYGAGLLRIPPGQEISCTQLAHVPRKFN